MKENWKCTVYISRNTGDGYFEESSTPFEILGDTKEEVLAQIHNVIYMFLELDRFSGNGNEFWIDYTIELNEEYNDHDEFIIKPEIIYTSEPSKLINWGEHTKRLPIIYSIDREKSKLNILISED